MKKYGFYLWFSISRKYQTFTKFLFQFTNVYSCLTLKMGIKQKQESYLNQFGSFLVQKVANLLLVRSSGVESNVYLEISVG